MKKIILFLILQMTLNYFSLYAQDTKSGHVSTVVKKISFQQIMEYNRKHPAIYKPFRSANEEEEEMPRNKPIKESERKPFTGKLLTLSPQTQTRLEQVVQCNNFLALGDDGTAAPPDTHGGVGFDYLMTTLNTQIRIQDKQGNNARYANGEETDSVSLASFWSATPHTDVFDPKVFYDSYSHRWVFVSCATRRSPNSAILVAVSENYDPTGNWNIYDIDADPANMLWFDYPSVGINNRWIVITGNMFPIPGITSTFRSRVFVIDKNAAYAGNNLATTFFDRAENSTICPAVTYDPNENTMWCVSVENSNDNNNGFVRLFSITGSTASPVFNPTNLVNVGAAWSNTTVGAPQLNSTTTLDLGDDRIKNAVVRNGRIWFAQNIYLPATNPTYAGIMYVGITLSNATAFQTAVLSNSAGTTMYGYPSIAVNSQDEQVLGFTIFKTTAYASAAVLFSPTILEYKAGEDWYVKIDGQGRNRWGDYSATSVDPEDDKTIWTIQEYARPRTGTTSFSGTWWSKICNNTCGSDLSLTNTELPGTFRKYEVSNIITSTSLISSGTFLKYDAGTKIRLLPPFKAVAGSKFKAVIDGCGGIY